MFQIQRKSLRRAMRACVRACVRSHAFLRKVVVLYSQVRHALILYSYHHRQRVISPSPSTSIIVKLNYTIVWTLSLEMNMIRHHISCGSSPQSRYVFHLFFLLYLAFSSPAVSFSSSCSPSYLSAGCDSSSSPRCCHPDGCLQIYSSKPFLKDHITVFSLQVSPYT